MANGLLEGVFVVIPVYNEAAVLAGVLGQVAAVVGAARVVVVDDGSSDESSAVARSAGVVALRHVINRGQGASLQTGIDAALRRGARVIVTFDADGQHDPDDIPALVAPILAGEAQVVLGTRFAPGSSTQIPGVRRLILKAAVVMTRCLSRVKVTDAHNGLRALSARAATLIRLRQDRMEHASEILDEIRRHRLKYVERPVRVRYSEYSLAKGQKNADALGLALRVIFSKVSR